MGRTSVLGGVGPARVVGLEAVRVLRSGARSGLLVGLPGLLVRLAGLGWLVGGGLCGLLVGSRLGGGLGGGAGAGGRGLVSERSGSGPGSGEASAVAVAVGEALGEGVSSAIAVVPDPATRSPSVSATASRLRRARNEVCVTVIVRTVLTHEG